MKYEKLASHLSARLWISKDKIEKVLGDFNEVPEPIVEMPVKMPIESEPKPQRDYTGVRFKFKKADRIFTLRNTDKKDYYTCADKGTIGNCWNRVLVEKLFRFGTWIEVKEETP
jgi:hypothetical protein